MVHFSPRTTIALLLGICGLVGGTLLLRNGVQASSTPQPSYYSAKEWKEIYASVREVWANQGVHEPGVVYRWDGPTPFLMQGQMVDRDAIGLTDEEANGLPSQLWQPEPAAWAELMGSEYWIPTSRRPPGSAMVDDGPPTNCQISVVFPPAGASYAICDGGCESPLICNPDATGHYCGCAPAGQLPTSPPAYCHGSVTHISGGTWQWDCSPQSACSAPTPECDILIYFDAQHNKHLYCGCM